MKDNIGLIDVDGHNFPDFADFMPRKGFKCSEYLEQ